MIKLEQYYPGDEDWEAFFVLYKNIPEPTEVPELNGIFNDRALACVIGGIMGDAALAWIERKMPALDHLRPVDCNGNAELEKRLRTLLMRMDL